MAAGGEGMHPGSGIAEGGSPPLVVWVKSAEGIDFKPVDWKTSCKERRKRATKRENGPVRARKWAGQGGRLGVANGLGVGSQLLGGAANRGVCGWYQRRWSRKDHG